jgi:hypothetical protein
MTSNGLRAQYLMPNLSLSAIAYPSIRPLRSGHVITQSHKISANSPSVERKRIADRRLLCRIFLKKPSFFRTDFFTELGPQVRLLLVPNFGVNSFYYSKYEIQKYIFVFLPVTFGEGLGLPSLLIFRCILHLRR